MSRRLVLIILVIVVSGFIATLISGLYEQDLSQALGVSITGYGFPLSWYKESQIVYPGIPTTYSICWESFSLDIAFWSLIATLLAVIVYKRKHQTRNKKREV